MSALARAADHPGTDELLVASGISKRYGTVVALHHADFACRAGEVHAVLGENGAGKSTLIKILGGTVRADAGSVQVARQPLRLGDPHAAAAAGIAAVYQELSIVPDLSVAQNIFLLREPLTMLRTVNRRALRRQAEDLFHDLKLEGIDPDQRAGRLSLAKKQLVEIAKMAARRSRMLILDEPTSALAETEVTWLLDLMQRWRTEGRTIIFISHRYGEIQAVADRLSIYRNGTRVAVFPAGSVSDDEVVRAMCGRPIETLYPERTALPKAAPVELEVKDLWQRRAVRGVSFAVHAGEILGIGGLAGQGQIELFLALFGALPYRGQIARRGRPIQVRRPADAVKAGLGIALVPADRKTEGLALRRSVRENMSLPALRLLTQWGIVNRQDERRRVGALVDTLHIAVGDIDAPVYHLSGGNQQKVVIGKWLLTGAGVLLLFDVTRGVDVATKAQIYQLIVDTAARGAAILFYSTDTQEILHLCHRVLVLYDGQIARTLEGDEIDEHQIVSAAFGRGSDDPAR